MEEQQQGIGVEVDRTSAQVGHTVIGTATLVLQNAAAMTLRPHAQAVGSPVPLICATPRAAHSTPMQNVGWIDVGVLARLGFTSQTRLKSLRSAAMVPGMCTEMGTVMIGVAWKSSISAQFVNDVVGIAVTSTDPQSAFLCKVEVLCSSLIVAVSYQ